MSVQDQLPLILPQPTVPETLEQRFARLVTTWKHERGPYSSSAGLAKHPAYQEIIALGVEVVPLLLRELEQQPDHWFRALQAITGADPVLAAQRGNLQAMAAAWLQWGHDQGYRW